MGSMRLRLSFLLVVFLFVRVEGSREPGRRRVTTSSIAAPTAFSPTPSSFRGKSSSSSAAAPPWRAGRGRSRPGTRRDAPARSAGSGTRPHPRQRLRPRGSCVARARPERRLRRAELPLSRERPSGRSGVRPALGPAQRRRPRHRRARGLGHADGQRGSRRRRHRQRRRLRPPGPERQHLDEPRRPARTASTTTATGRSTTPAAGTSSRTTTRRSTSTATARTSPGRSAPRATTAPASPASTGTSRSCRYGRRTPSGPARERDRQLDQLRLRRAAPTWSTAASAARAGRPRSATRSSRTRCKDTLFVFAAGNGGRVLNKNTNATNTFPCEYWRAAPNGAGAKNLVCVAASNPNDALASFSNRGKSAVHLAAPGVDIHSSVPEWSAIFSDDFESGFGNWTQAGGTNPWQLTSELASSGASSMTDSPGARYSNSRDYRTRNNAAVNLSGRVGCLLDYDLELLIRDFNPTTGHVFDWFAVDRSTSSTGPWTELSFYFGSTSGDFVTLTEDLSALDGQASGLRPLPRLHRRDGQGRRRARRRRGRQVPDTQRRGLRRVRRHVDGVAPRSGRGGAAPCPRSRR